MIRPSEQLDRRFTDMRPFIENAARPSRGWVRAIRDALGMTTAQLAKRMGVSQPRIVELEKSEMHGNITLHSMERAAEAMGCRVVYALVPMKPLTKTLHEQADKVARDQLASVEQTMRLEDQGVRDPESQAATLRHLTNELLRRPARLWDNV